jgi:hypothetical protein
LEGLAIEDGMLWTFGMFYGHLVYFMDIWYICWSFGIIFPFWYVVTRKSGNPALHRRGSDQNLIYALPLFLPRSKKMMKLSFRGQKKGWGRGFHPFQRFTGPVDQRPML